MSLIDIFKNLSTISQKCNENKKISLYLRGC